MFQTKNAANAVIVSLSKPSKMPGYSWGIPAGSSCPVGAKLMQVEGSICSNCYAQKGLYQFANVQLAQQSRKESTYNLFWESAMVRLIQDQDFFRWHDSGDFFSYWYLEKVMRVIRKTPNTKHWIPTKEKGLIKRYIREYGALPSNCVVRVSAAMINGKAPDMPNTSTVHTTAGEFQGSECTAYKRGGKCGNCRKCWNPKVKNISYLIH